MNNVRKHMDKLFANYPKTNETLELKEEVIGNIEAEIEDLQSHGLSFEEAFRKSIGKMEKLDGLIDGVKSVRISKVLMEMMQWTLIYTLIAWIITIPLSVFYMFRRASWALFLIIIVIGLSYLINYTIGKLLSRDYVQVNLYKISAVRKYVWIIWSLYIVATWGIVTAMLFGSNIWFGRPITIDGPYEFATSCVMYVSPIITIIVPLLMNKYQKIIMKQGEGSPDEE
ncbi:permease prefix domain 1-containing protein [Sporosarcina beigongshangi]|uniref:permease prefix domain 1-containing protein n=1 Tax=Sporosarcina beigongshangi TaxID=2782538 RepID=UPI001939CD3E|nr:permease prefix domain 1-containing protein [Sporosarcina beigongshangi]